MKALVVLIYGARDDVEYSTAALASAAVFYGCFRLRTDDV